MDHLAKEKAKTIISDLEGKLKWSEESHQSMAAKAAKKENCIEGLNALLRDSKRDILWVRDELGIERNHCIRVENDFKMVVKSLVKKAIANTLERARLKVEEEIKTEKRDMMEEALRGAEA